MPDQQQNKQVYTKGLNKDLVNFLQSPEAWQHALNLINNSSSGDSLVLSTEPANKLCVTFPYPLIGAISLDQQQWMTFHTDNTNSEIGIVDASRCTYTKFSNTPCLSFSQSYLITGASRRNSDCGFNVYWADGLNPDRYVNTNTTDVNNNIWVQTCSGTDCITCINTDVLNCNKIRIAPLMQIPCVRLNKSQGAGTLLNGTYQVAIAYAVNGIKVTDYVIISNSQSIFSHTNQAGAITCTITNADTTHFKEMLVTVVSYVNSQLTAKKLGIFDTTTDQLTIPIDNINNTLVTENIANIPLQTFALEKSDSIWEVNDYLLRNGIYEKPDFNYQLLANNINTDWVLVEYPDDYYQKAGNEFGMNVSYLRDEVYCFFIRWIYNTGDKSASYHIPGRAYDPATDVPWTTQNTASINTFPGGTVDGGDILAKGVMSYWESTFKYPDHQANVYGPLCGQPIRHHKFPDQTISNVLTHFRDTGSPSGTATKTIRILGVQFSNIASPVDNLGNPITNIVGYEILRGSREGNKSVLAKGMLNNMRGYPATAPSTVQGLYQNYPYNDLQPDRFLTTSQAIGTIGGTIDDYAGNEQTIVKNDIFSFHSPDTVFSKPFLGLGQLRIYQTIAGYSEGHYLRPYKHPKFKILTKLDNVFATTIATITSLSNVLSAISGGATSAGFAGTPDVPYYSPLGGINGFVEGTYGALGEALYAIAEVTNIVLVALMLPLNFRITQQQILNVITGLIPADQYATQYNSHGFYNDYFQVIPNFNSPIYNYQYVGGYTQSFEGFTLNNLFRNDYVIIKTNQITPATIPGTPFETSRFTLGQRPSGSSFEQLWQDRIFSYYGGYKINFPGQYGQLGSVRQLPITNCIYTPNANTGISASPILFGGDTYINRYTEKNPFLFFNDWLVDVKDDFAYDYTNFENVPYPRYWVNNTHVYYDFWASADKNFHLDEYSAGPALSFYVHDGFFYLFCNGVRDFYVESDVNVGFRDWEEDLTKRFFDPYGYQDIEYMFRSDMIKNNTLYKYDYSLSVSKFYSQYVSFGQILDRQYNPELAYTCYDYFPRRIAYSLPQTEELKLDNWRQFLPNNFVDMPTKVRAIKSISKTGALFMMDDDSPVQFTGTQVLQQGEAGNTAITIGDGGLFNQGLQSTVNVDKSLGYGSCKSRYSVVNVPHGLFWVSQKAGKIFKYTNTLEEISATGLRFWFAKYLPSRLLEQFPDYPLSDNPVIGVGVQTSYDETYEILYISKKDYKLKSQYIGQVILIGSDFFLTTPKASGRFPISVTNSLYFEDCSWTVSYCCKNKYWISHHSWKPDFILNTQQHHSTTKASKLWRHNDRTDKFAEYYGIPAFVELAYNINTQATTTTLRNIEYLLETYDYKANGQDRNQLFDFNWDKAIIYNNEQMSGWLDLFAKSDNPYTNLQYPILGPNSIGIPYSIKEHKYRINMFWDITADRQNLTQMWNTPENGIDYVINPLYTDYAKPLTQAKKFRNYNNSVFFRKLVSEDKQMQIRMNTEQFQLSPR